MLASPRMFIAGAEVMRVERSSGREQQMFGTGQTKMHPRP
jgi:hypothetical protein